MNTVAKRIVSVLLTLVMVFSVVTTTPVKANTTGTVTFTIEKLTIGQGFFVEPKQISIYANDTVKTVFDRVMESISWSYVSSSDFGFYLKSISDIDTGVIKIPQEIVLMPSYKSSYTDEEGITHDFEYKTPNDKENIGNALKPALGEGSYSEMAGWMFTVNNQSSTASADKIKVKNGDVIRLQFSLYGYGADLGYDTSSYTSIPKLTMANKDELIKTIAAVNAKKTYWMVYPNVATAYNSAMSVLNTYNPNQQTVNTAATALNSAIKNPTNPPVGRATINKLKNVKGKKVKITVKKMTGITGFKYRYANNKKFKKSTNKLTTKNTLTTKKLKKLKKNKRCYVKVCAYKKVNGKRVFGKWSKVKSIKVKK